MKKSRFNIEAFLLTMIMTAGWLMPMPMKAQGGRADGFISELEMIETRDNNWLSCVILNDNFGAPLGSGIWVMAAAGAAYGIVKRRRGFGSKHVGVLLLTPLLMLGLTQCKKSAVQPGGYPSVAIKLEIPNNSKTDVNVLTGAVNFEDGDEVLVANNGVYVGTLTYGNGSFSGNISASNTSDYLHFYHIANRKISNLNAGSTSSIAFDIKDQILKPAVVSYGHSTELYHGAGTYNAVLMNKCALVKFNVTTSSRSCATVIKNMNNSVTINLAKKDADDAFSYSVKNYGGISMAPGSGERWVTLLPQAAVSTGSASSVMSGRYQGTRPAIPAINADDHLTQGIDIVAQNEFKPEGAQGGLFTIDSEGHQVYFGCGNFMTMHLSNMWNFQTNPYIITVNADRTVATNSTDMSTLTIYGWGTSGFDDGATAYQAGSTSSTNSHYNPYGSLSTNLYDGNGRADWGYNMNQVAGWNYKQWRTLTADEWEYIFTQREDADQKYSYATIQNMPGLLLMSDNWVKPSSVEFTPGVTDNFTTNVYDKSKWTAMRNAGAVFLPCEGYREGRNIVQVKNKAYYWSSSRCDDDNAYAVQIDAESGFAAKVAIPRSRGVCVRLVVD